MRLKFKNYARVLQNSVEGSLFEWRLFVNEPPQVLDRIESVIYTLPPTFSHPSRMITDAAGGFALEGHGAREFNVLATVLYKDHTEETQQHHVDFSKPWPAEPVSA